MEIVEGQCFYSMTIPSDQPKLFIKISIAVKTKFRIYLAAFAFLFAACHDKEENTILVQFFEDNILNQNFIITHANDEASDLTANYIGYNFVLKKGSNYRNGPLVVTKGSLIYNGTWQTNEDYSKLKIQLPSVPSEFIFLSRDWRFTSKAIPELKFAPWGGSDGIQLTMKRQ